MGIATWHATDGTNYENCVTFCRIRARYGALSNIATKYPLEVNGVRIGSSEALYQACRFPHRPEWQHDVIAAKCALEAKRASRIDQRSEQSRPDWNNVRVEIMDWCLRVKLTQHFRRFSAVLISTGDTMIVEKSSRDNFWGAIPDDEGILHGANILGRLLTALRDEVAGLLKSSETRCWSTVQPPNIPDFHLYGRPIEVVSARQSPLVLGRDLIERGLTPGKSFGPILRQCYEAQESGAFSDRDEGLSFLDTLLDRWPRPGHDVAPHPPGSCED